MRSPSSGTLRSARTKTRRPSTATSLIVFIITPSPRAGARQADSPGLAVPPWSRLRPAGQGRSARLWGTFALGHGAQRNAPADPGPVRGRLNLDPDAVLAGPL